MEESHPINEAMRYIDNARTLLSEKAGKDGNYYTDKKYIKMAGHTAWCGVLIALDAVLKVTKRTKMGYRPDIKDYQEAIAKIDKKMPRIMMNAYDTLHKVLGYDGNLNYRIVQGGLEEAENMIVWAEKHYVN